MWSKFSFTGTMLVEGHLRPIEEKVATDHLRFDHHFLEITPKGLRGPANGAELKESNLPDVARYPTGLPCNKTSKLGNLG